MEAVTDTLTSIEQAAVFGGTAARIYSLQHDQMHS